MSILGIFGPPDVQKLKSEKDINGLMKALNYQKSNETRIRAAEALGELRATEAFGLLVETLKVHDADLRNAISNTLSRIGGPVVYLLMRELKGGDRELRRAVFSILERIGAPAVGPFMAIFVEKDRTFNKELEELVLTADATAFKFVVTASEDKQVWIREAAAMMLGKMGNIEGLGAICKLLSDSDPWVRRAAVEALRKLGHMETLEPLLAATKDMDWYVREAAAEALGELHDSRSTERLCEMLELDEGETIRIRAAEALGNLEILRHCLRY